MPEHKWDWLFAIGTIFASLDAFNIGANDVANSFATSVASRSLTLRQACIAAALCEFLGAVLAGARVSQTIKDNIIEISAFRGDAGVQLLGFTCALVASATWLMIATHQSWPVSTTYSITSALAGVGVAIGGRKAVNWGWDNATGMAAIYAGFIIAPGLAGAFAATIYLLTKYLVLVRENSTKAGLYASPFFFFTTTTVLTMSIVYKGAPALHLDHLSKTTTAAAIIGTAATVTLLSVIFWLPYVYGKVVKNDYTLRWYHLFVGPTLWWREAPEDARGIGAQSAVPDYRVVRDGMTHGYPTPADMEKNSHNIPELHVPSEGSHRHLTTHESASAYSHSRGEESQRHSEAVAVTVDYNHDIQETQLHQRRPYVNQHDYSPHSPHHQYSPNHPHNPHARWQDEEAYDEDDDAYSDSTTHTHPIEGIWIHPRNLWIILRHRIYPFFVKIFTHGTSVDIHALQRHEREGKKAKRMAAMHTRAKQYDNKVEHLYSFIQVMTACTASFAHGSNDVANAIGPYSAIYAVWSSGKLVDSETPVPVWILAFGGAWIVIGLSTYGYNIMRVLGNRLTLQSPSRGYSMELGSAITVILASQYGIPVSTTMCITGATLGVGLCNGDFRALNWRGLGWIVLGWLLTPPIAGVAAGCLMGILLNAPHFT
ncbi:sodium:inorganic phosphate symporter [Serendipita vermifera]|nr:sodium:inorganic phosphate symporter [Serendipita vermifera]